MGDPLLKPYSVLVLDEVHERTAQIDIIMGKATLVNLFSLLLFLSRNGRYERYVDTVHVNMYESVRFFIA